MEWKSLFYFFAVEVVLVCGWSPPPLGDMKQALDECKTTIEASPEDIMMIMQQQVPQTPKGLCLYACIKKKTGTLGPDNKLNMEKVKQSLTPMKIRGGNYYNNMVSIFEQCNEEPADPDECVAVKNLADCISAKKKERVNSVIMDGLGQVTQLTDMFSM